MSKRIALVILLLLVTVLPTIIISQPAYAATRNLYWCVHDGGGTGVWSDIGHWSLDGVTGGEAVPDADDNVYFNASSFNGAGQVVTVDATAYCLDLDFTGATNSPTLVGPDVVQIYDNTTLIAAMTITARLAFLGGTQTLRTNGLSLGASYNQIGSTVKLTLLDDLSAVRLAQDGKIDTDGKSVTLSGVWDFPWGGSPELTFGASVITLTGWGTVTATPVIAANTAIINCSGDFIGMGVLNYNIVNLTGATSTVSGSNTFAELNLASGTTQTITFTDGTTQTVTGANLSGSVGHVHTLQGTGVAGWTINKSGNWANDGSFCNYISISNSHGHPTNAWWYLASTCTNGSGNIDWKPINLTVNQSISEGDSFFENLTGLTANTTYCFQAIANNPLGTFYGTWRCFTTQAVGYAPNGVSCSAGSNSITLLWTKNLSAETYIRWKIGSYPTSISDGTLIPIQTGNSYTHTGLSSGTSYYYTLWGYDNPTTSTTCSSTMCSTTAGDISSTPAPLPTLDMSGATTAPNGSALVNNPLYGLGNLEAAAISVPQGTWWMLIGMGGLVVTGLFIYTRSRNLLAALGAMIIFGVIMANMGIMPIWIMYVFGLSGIGMSWKELR